MSNRNKKGPRLDATNLAGITDLMNPQNVRQDVDLENAEHAVMKRTDAPTLEETADPIEIYTKELNELADELGINLLDGGHEENVAPPKTSSIGNFSKISDPLGGETIDKLVSNLDLGSDSVVTNSESESNSEASGESETTTSGGNSEDGSEETTTSYETESSSIATKNYEKSLGINLKGTHDRGKRFQRIHTKSTSRHSNNSEQSRRHHIEAVMGELRKGTHTSLGKEHERIQDIKVSKIEQIGQLRMTLEEEGVDCSEVGIPMMTSSMEEIDGVLGILKLKNDRNRCSSLAEEVILGVAEGIETVFNGTREVPIFGWKPDFTGYHNTVNVKLHRMRFETSQVVGSIIEKYKIGPAARIVMELLPSFFLYPRQQCNQRRAPGLYTDLDAHPPADARSAYSAIRRANTPETLTNLSML